MLFRSMPQPDDTSCNRSSTRPSIVAQTVVDILRVNLPRLSRRSGVEPPKLSRKQRDALSMLFISAYAEAVASDERRKMLEGIDTL